MGRVWAETFGRKDRFPHLGLFQSGLLLPVTCKFPHVLLRLRSYSATTSCGVWALGRSCGDCLGRSSCSPLSGAEQDLQARKTNSKLRREDEGQFSFDKCQNQRFAFPVMSSENRFLFFL
jgi:hypothetical protein